jgi:hypothetical protein
MRIPRSGLALLAILSASACSNDELKKLPRPVRLADAQPAPPPPPPRADEGGRTPPELRAFLARHEQAAWRVTLAKRVLSPEDSRAFVEHIAPDAAWSSGVVGCVGPTTPMTIEAAGDVLAARYTCASLWIDRQQYSFDPRTADWIVAFCRDHHVDCS